jgi:hypothetical protein
MGLTDPEPRSWDGSVQASAGEVIALQSWRPRGVDKIDGTKWSLATTQGAKFRYRNWEPEPSTPVPDYVYVPGLFMTVEGGPDTRLTLNTNQGAVSFRWGDVPVGQRKLFLNGAVSVERAVSAESVSGDGHEAGFADIAGDGKGGYWVAWVGYKDWSNRVSVRHFDGSSWSEPQELTGAADVYLVRLAADGRGGVWAVWSDQKEGNFDLWARRYDGQSWSAAERMTAALGPDIHQALATDAQGGVWLAWQGFRNEQSEILARRWDGSSWTGEEVISVSDKDDWNPSVTTCPGGGVWIAWDTYDKGDYDVLMRGRQGEERFGELVTVAATPRYEAYPSIACDAEGRVWAAWNESDMQWGKDTGFLLRRQATQLYSSRWIRTGVYGNGEWRRPLAEFEASLPEDLRGFNDYPRVQIDGKGRVWMLFRHRFLRQREVPPMAASHRAAWETFATAFDGRGWTTPTPLPSTQGRSDTGVGFTTLAGGELAAAWATDNRIYDELFFEKGEIFAGRIPEPSGDVVAARLKPLVPDELTIFQNHPNEAADVARVRDYTIDSAGKQYKIYRGDLHRHTEYSADGNNDGSLNDTYRYAINAAAFDYLGLSDHHTGGPNIEYINWLLQQRVDVFTVPGRFTPLYGYERGLSYPQGHRNVFFSDRGNPTLPTLENENDPDVGAKPLYAYLKKYNGVTMSHTSATGMGTDWRDNDPEVEPLVEIYQGDRVSAEYEGAPKAAVASDVTSQAGGLRPKGYVWNAWAKGYKLGVQASSDHLSTHISYANLISEDHSREGLMDAMRKRHAYASTDNIILDYRLRTDGKEYIQGDIVRSESGKFNFPIHIIGTAPIQQVDIIRNNQFMLTLQNREAEMDFTYTDQTPVAGESYYYVRVQQADGQMAWSSPIWITLP